jgi:hypothetical protein
MHSWPMAPGVEMPRKVEAERVSGPAGRSGVQRLPDARAAGGAPAGNRNRPEAWRVLSRDVCTASSVAETVSGVTLYTRLN